jgi:hypothetical protein
MNLHNTKVVSFVPLKGAWLSWLIEGFNTNQFSVIKTEITFLQFCQLLNCI